MQLSITRRGGRLLTCIPGTGFAKRGEDQSLFNHRIMTKHRESEGDKKEDWPVATPMELDASQRCPATPDGPIAVCIVLCPFHFLL